MSEIDKKLEEEMILEDREKVTYEQLIEEYFQKYEDFFPNEQAKAVFLEGVLAGFLLEVQRIKNPDNTGNEPFWRSLRGLKLDARVFKDLFPKIVDKLKLYRLSYSGLVSTISEFIQKAGNLGTLDKIEISWFFTHGLASYNVLKRKESKSKDNKSKK